MNISVCCPSYKRAKVKTLEYLPFCKVYVDESEEKEYRQENPKANICVCAKGIQGNVARVRNYIIDKEIEGGADVVCLVDDDITDIGFYEKDDFHKLETEDFLMFVEKYTTLCKEFGFYLWGVNVHRDKMAYREYSPFSTVSVILGPFCCHLKGSQIRYDEELPLKEDYDLFIQHCNKYRGVLRLNKYSYLCKQSTNPGGCAAMRNFQKEKSQFDMLVQKWGSQIVREDKGNRSNKKRVTMDYNPIIKIPIKGI